MTTYRVVALSSVSAPVEPLRHAIERGSLEELASSIQQVGLLQPLTVKTAPNGYEVKAGHRRLLASRMAGLATIPVMIRDDESAVEAAVMLVENLQRADLSPIEEARAILKMRDVLGRSIDQIATSLSRSEAWVRGRLELLTWPALALEAIADGRASVTSLRPLLEIENIVERDRLLGCAIDAGATSAVTRAWAQQANGQFSDGAESMSGRSRALLPLGNVQVLMRCYSCREQKDAFSLGVLRVCRPCIEELENAATAVGAVVGAATGAP